MLSVLAEQQMLTRPFSKIYYAAIQPAGDLWPCPSMAEREAQFALYLERMEVIRHSIDDLGLGLGYHWSSVSFWTFSDRQAITAGGGSWVSSLPVQQDGQHCPALYDAVLSFSRAHSGSL